MAVIPSNSNPKALFTFYLEKPYRFQSAESKVGVHAVKGKKKKNRTNMARISRTVFNRRKEAKTNPSLTQKSNAGSTVLRGPTNGPLFRNLDHSAGMC